MKLTTMLNEEFEDLPTIGRIRFSVAAIKHNNGLAFQFLPRKILHQAVKKGLTKLIEQQLDRMFPLFKGKWAKDKNHPAAGIVMLCSYIDMSAAIQSAVSDDMPIVK